MKKQATRPVFFALRLRFAIVGMTWSQLYHQGDDNEYYPKLSENFLMFRQVCFVLLKFLTL